MVAALAPVVLALAAGVAEGPVREYVPDRVLVQLAVRLERSPDRAAIEAVFRDLGVVGAAGLRRPAKLPRAVESFRRLGLDRVVRLELGAGSDVESAVARLAATPGVVWAEPDLVDRAFGSNVPDDPLFTAQWGLDQASDADVDGPEAWAIATGTAALVAVLDSGIDAAHADLADKIEAGFDFVNGDADPADDFGHGTSVSSVAAARTNDGFGIAGACWLCRILPVKVLDESGDGAVSDFVDGVIWAVDQGARALNFSAGGEHSETRILAVKYAHDAGAVFVTAAGNGTVVAFPARYGQTIAVGGSDPSDELASFSPTGRALDVLAPAVDIPVATLGGGHMISDGTSFAAPLVAGLAALIDDVHPSVGVEELRQLVRSAADDQVGDPSLDLPGPDANHGSGRVNMERTLLEAQRTQSLRVEGKSATRLYYATPSGVAPTYDFIRGDLAALSESASGVALGPVVCLENDSADADTAGDEDHATPAPGAGFFYLGRFNSGPWAGSYGGSSRHRDRLTPEPAAAADWIAVESVAGSNFGVSVASAGDVNDDGYDDVIIGAGDKPTASGNGVAVVYHGSAAGLASAPAWTLASTQLDSNLGFSVAGVGDVNADGYDDVAVGEPLYDGTLGQNEGRIHVYLGSASGLGTVAHRVLVPGQAQARFGFGVAPAGDVNDDGFADLIVAAQRYDNGQQNEGRAYVFRGSALGVQIAPLWTFEPNSAEAWLGAVGPAGDVNHDGYGDVIVGAERFTNVAERTGRAWVFHGSASGPGAAPAVTLEVGGTDSRFGTSVHTAGDVDSDTFDDVIVTAQFYGNGEVQEGAAFLYRGSGAGVSATAAWIHEADRNEASLGAAATAGDVDADGYDDVIVGEQFARRSLLNEGAARLFHGSAAGLAPSADWNEFGLQQDANFGFSVARAGDVDGDGYDDVLVSAKGYENGGWNEGRVLLYRGSPAGITLVTALDGCDAVGP